MLASNSVQEVMDFALIAQAATLESRIPFVHFFDGFRTSHEVAKVEQLTVEDMRAMIDDELVAAHRARALSPDRPVLRGTAQNPDVYFQARETVNPLLPRRARPSCRTRWTSSRSSSGRQYHLFDYVGAPDAERVIVMMGSGAEVAQEAVEYLIASGEKVGLLKVRLYRPFSIEHFHRRPAGDVRSPSPSSTAPRSPARSASRSTWTSSRRWPKRCAPRRSPKVIGGRYGLSSKEFTPAMVKGVFDELAKPHRKNHFTVGIDDDVTHTSLDYDPTFSTEDAEHRARAVLRAGRGWHGRREQELHQDHRRRNRQLTRRATSSTTRRSPARSPPPTCASDPSRSAPAT